MSSPFRMFSISSTLGLGNREPRRGVRRKLSDILSLAGHAPAGDGVEVAVPAFQKDLGLKSDGIINPGGPTESALNALAVAGQKGGAPMVDAVKPVIRNLSQQGLMFTPDSRNADALGMWRDTNGGRVDPERAGQMLRFTGSGTDLSGPQQIFTERLVGKTGRDKIMKASGGGASADPFQEIDNPNKEGNFTSGAMRRAADRIVEDTDATRREADRERAGRRPHRDVEKIEWEATPRTPRKTTEFAAKVKDAVRIDYESDAVGIDGANIEVDWFPLDARGNIVPEFRKPGRRVQNAGGLLIGSPLGGGASTVMISPYPNPHGFRVKIKVPPQAPINQNSTGVKFHLFVPKGEFVSQEPLR